MNIWKISIQNIKSKPLYTFLSVFTLSLSIVLLLGVQQLKTSFNHQMKNNLGTIDMVIGAKGSPLQLVLASVLHLDNPTGNIAYQEAKAFMKNPMIKSAVPISYGDNYKGFRIVGTTNAFTFIYQAQLAKGNLSKKTLEVVLGSSVADKLQLSIGDTFLSSHGLIENEIDIHHQEFTIVGILKPTQKVIDRLIITDLKSIWDVHHHEEETHHHHEEKPEEEDEKEITSLLVSFKTPMALLTLPRKINKETNMLAALPKHELNKLYEFIGIGFTTISGIAYFILMISGLIIFISLYKMVRERSFDLAILRTYGASNFQLIKMITYEALSIVSLALVTGFFLTKILFIFIISTNQQQLILQLTIKEVLEIAGLILLFVALSVFLAIYPIIKMNISTILSNEK